MKKTLFILVFTSVACAPYSFCAAADQAYLAIEKLPQVLSVPKGEPIHRTIQLCNTDQETLCIQYIPVKNKYMWILTESVEKKSILYFSPFVHGILLSCLYGQATVKDILSNFESLLKDEISFLDFTKWERADTICRKFASCSKPDINVQLKDDILKSLGLLNMPKQLKAYSFVENLFKGDQEINCDYVLSCQYQFHHGTLSKVKTHTLTMNPPKGMPYGKIITSTNNDLICFTMRSFLQNGGLLNVMSIIGEEFLSGQQFTRLMSQNGNYFLLVHLVGYIQHGYHFSKTFSDFLSGRVFKN